MPCVEFRSTGAMSLVNLSCPSSFPVRGRSRRALYNRSSAGRDETREESEVPIGVGGKRFRLEQVPGERST